MEYSHSVLKKPKNADFRVQTEFGGHTQSFSPNRQLTDLAENVLTKLPHPWLYARIDVVDWQNSPLISEVEVIEPSLYLSFDSQAPQRLALAVQSELRF
jgi:glutathione synthase/RimK-type ligase-like ATP-grasp enzyme